MATPSAEPHCRVAVSSALAVPSDLAVTAPRVSARVEETWASRAATPSANWAASSAGSEPVSTATAASARASSAMPIGTLTKNTSRQLTSASRPPRTAPEAKPAETTAP